MELIKQITVSQSETLQHKYYGGRDYEKTDLFECEHEQVPASMDEKDCEEVHAELRKRVEARIQERKNALIAQLKAGPTPF